MKLRLVPLIIVAFAGSLSCSNRITTPVVLPDEDIRFELVAVGGGSPGAAVTFRGLVRNAGGAAVLPFVPCPEPYIRIYDASRNELFQTNPTRPVPCPLADVPPLRPGQTLEFSLTFDGRYFNETGDALTAPVGTYRVIATFKYSPPHPAGATDLHGLTRELSFNWQ